GAARAAVDHEILGPLGDLGVEVVHEHAQRRLGLPRAGREGGTARGTDGAGHRDLPVESTFGWGGAGTTTAVMRALRRRRSLPRALHRCERARPRRRSPG